MPRQRPQRRLAAVPSRGPGGDPAPVNGETADAPFASITINVARTVLSLSEGNGVDIIPPPPSMSGPHVLVFDPTIRAWRGFRLAPGTRWSLKTAAPSLWLPGQPTGLPPAN